MFKSKVVVTLIILCSMFFLVYHINGNLSLAGTFKAFVVPLFTILYFLNVRNRSSHFTLFLVAYSISDLLVLFNNYLPRGMDYYYGNALYMVAYVALVIEILKSIDFKQIYTHFKAHIIVLLVLNIYANRVLFNITNDYSMSGLDLGFEILYNACILILLSVALLNYFYRDDKKAYLLFLGTICIVVSEVIQVAYYYIPEVEDDNLLSVSYSLLLIVSFFFFYYQSKRDYDELLLYA